MMVVARLAQAECAVWLKDSKKKKKLEIVYVPGQAPPHDLHQRLHARIDKLQRALVLVMSVSQVQLVALFAVFHGKRLARVYIYGSIGVPVAINLRNKCHVACNVAMNGSFCELKPFFREGPWKSKNHVLNTNVCYALDFFISFSICEHRKLLFVLFRQFIYPLLTGKPPEVQCPFLRTPLSLCWDQMDCIEIKQNKAGSMLWRAQRFQCSILQNLRFKSI